jgi:ATP-binding cassette subfamily F protein 3
MKEYEKQQGQVAKLEDFIQKNIVRASTTKRAQSRRKQLEKMELLDRPAGSEKSASFSFEIEKQTGNDVLKLENISTGYEAAAPLFKNVQLAVSRQDSIAIVGPNGIGKSTLLKVIRKKLPLMTGEIRFGSQLMISHYDQEQADLHSKKTLLNELWDDYPDRTEKEIRSILGQFLFSGDDVLKLVNELSGGQKARLALSKLMMEKGNLLLLDEPTNHLDLDSKEILETALIHYPGTILFVSHDRYFINRLATKVVELSPNGLTEYLGDYDYYTEKKNEMKALEEIAERQKAESSTASPADSQSSGKQSIDKEAKKLDRKRQRRIEEIEELLEAIETKITFAEGELCKPEVFQDYEKTQEYQSQLDQLNSDMESLMEEWEDLQNA